MRKHLLAVAAIYLLVGTTLAILFIYGHIQFFLLSESFFPESSVIGDDSFVQKSVRFYHVYRSFFNQFGINPFVSLLTIASSLAFGYGLLKSREWARKLGFLLIAVNVFSAAAAVFNNAVSAAGIVQLALTVYMWWVLTSDAAKSLMKNEIQVK